MDVSLSIDKFLNNQVDLTDKMRNRENVFVTIETASNGNVKNTIAGLYVIESINLSGDVGGLETESISLQINGCI